MEHIAISGKGNQAYSVFRQLELQQIFDFARSGEHLEEEAAKKQFCALWTAYCLHHDLDVDTSAYDTDLLSLWKVIECDGARESAWESYEAFNLFMGAWLC